jgi:transcriptional regulator with XRE-family HTH domain
MKLYGSLDNYIQMHRQRLGLSQADLSLLIAIEQRSSVSRYEQGLRFPNLETLLALEMVLGQPIRELFAGVAERVEESVGSRARTLLESLDDKPRKDLVVKIEALSRLAHFDEPRIVPIWEGGI